jgi:hypothetical protein
MISTSIYMKTVAFLNLIDYGVEMIDHWVGG